MSGGGTCSTCESTILRSCTCYLCSAVWKVCLVCRGNVRARRELGCGYRIYNNVYSGRAA